MPELALERDFFPAEHGKIPRRGTGRGYELQNAWPSPLLSSQNLNPTKDAANPVY